MNNRKPLPSKEVLTHLFSYNEFTGDLMWKNPPLKGRVKSGDFARSKFKSGYLRVSVAGSTYRVHNIAWKIMTGEDPVLEVDHIDRNKTNNSWSNLRSATTSQNVMNTALTSRNTSGFKGVSKVPCGKWKASVRHNGVLIYLGHHDTPEQAYEAYKAKAIELFGEFVWSEKNEK